MCSGGNGRGERVIFLGGRIWNRLEMGKWLLVVQNSGGQRRASECEVQEECCEIHETDAGEGGSKNGDEKWNAWLKERERVRRRMVDGCQRRSGE